MTQTEVESQRLEVLRAYGVLDTPPEPAYDEITELVAGICQAPIAVISLIDSERQWFKSVYGADWTATPRDIAFCAHAIEQRGRFLVADAERAPRFVSNPLVCGEVGLRFYAGVPLVDSADVALGALAVIERNPMPMWLFDVQSLRFLAVNDAAVMHYGWSPSEFAAMTVRDIRPAEDLPALMDDLAHDHRGLNGGRVWRHRKKNGELIQVDITAHSMPFQGHEARLVMANDVTEQLRATQGVQASEARWERLFAASATGIAAAGLDGCITRVNPAFCALVGRSQAELLGRPMLAFTHPGDSAACQRQFDRLTTGEAASVTIEKRYLLPDGSERWVRASVTLTSPSEPGQSAQPRRYVAVVQDIDAQRKAQAALSRQHGLVTLAGRLARLGGWQVLLQPSGSPPTVAWTDGLRAILEIPAGQEPGIEQALQMYPTGTRERVAAALQACLEQGEPFGMDAEIQTWAGNTLQLRLIGEAMRDPAGRIIGAPGALLEQTELQRAQRALRVSEERFRNVARATADAIWDWDLIERVVWWNEGMQTLFGHDLSKLEPGVESWSSGAIPKTSRPCVAASSPPSPAPTNAGAPNTASPEPTAPTRWCWTAAS